MAGPVPVEFVPAGRAVTEPVTKVGGRPVWLEGAQWPLSAESGEPMEFIGQFEVRGGKLAYVFMSEGAQGTFVPDGGENAVIVQPGGRVPDFVVGVRELAEGPTLGEDHLAVPGKPDEDGESWQFLGGPGVEPLWLQGEETPGAEEGAPWELLAQLDSTAMPVHVNFGDAGIGYAFLSPEGDEGRFLWQCT
ncbi:YwqG family protein [Streptomyces sp. NBC_00237]|uniref:hypothetical protein n=1 Tax=Streptomyces sp. NBC_00237 TaxID=2975687 RepID=UPI00225A69A2|nr:hypothetical protein [Streptomyces sp. NBC_00237]MCX5204270.1 YwqG family protein [Streptomyces sp. NBC_00237]